MTKEKQSNENSQMNKKKQRLYIKAVSTGFDMKSPLSNRLIELIQSGSSPETAAGWKLQRLSLPFFKGEKSYLMQ